MRWRGRGVGAVISPDGLYRYRLTRNVGAPGSKGVTACVLMINPSTADAMQDDATIRRLIGFAERTLKNFMGWDTD